jgi:3-deoxy-D-arabino-heptulosonate 7-phosphate (DAHP) synthase
LPFGLKDCTSGAVHVKVNGAHAHNAPAEDAAVETSGSRVSTAAKLREAWLL